MAAGAAGLLADATLVPVPADPRRRRRRGFDHAALLTAALARRTGLPVAACLRRRGPRRVSSVPARRRLARGPVRAQRGGERAGACGPRRRRAHHRRHARRVRAGAARGRREDRHRPHATRAGLGAWWSAPNPPERSRIDRHPRPYSDRVRDVHIRPSKGGPTMQIAVKGRNPGQRRAAGAHREALRQGRQAGIRAGQAGDRAPAGAQPVRSRVARRRGDAAPQGRHAARLRVPRRPAVTRSTSAPTSSPARSSATATSGASAARPARPHAPAVGPLTVAAGPPRPARRSRSPGGPPLVR